MKKKVIAFMMAAAFLCNPWAHPVHDSVTDQVAVSAAVTNTVPEGYTPIYTIDDLYAVRNNLSGKYILMNDIDLSATAPGGDWDSGNGWKPIGESEKNAFKGLFDGNGFAISNMHIYDKPDGQYMGLFGMCDFGASGYETRITNLALIDVDIDVKLDDYAGKSYWVGGIAGYAPNISNCYVTGNITVDYHGEEKYDTYIGGIAGENFRFITNSFNACNLTLYSDCKDTTCHNIGGISGYLNNGGINCCYNVSDISLYISKGDNSKPYVGDIVGDGVNLLQASHKLNTSYYFRENSLYKLSDYAMATSYAEDSEFSNVNGLTAGQMKSSAAFVGFDFDNVWTIDPTSAYPYPTLKNVPYVSSASSTQPATQPTTQPTTNPPSGSSLKGDINGDGFVNAKDATIILIYAAKTGTGQNVSIDDLY